MKYADVDSCACYKYLPKRKRTKGKFGELHFSHKYLGSGAVAHELQHFMFDWMRTHSGVSSRNEERLAQLMDDMTRVFWSAYFG